MKFKNITGIFFFLCILYFTIHPCQAGTNAAAFLNIGVGARALGMGGAFTSLSDDATAPYWNPAGLATLNKITLTTMIQSLAGSKWEGIEDITPKYQFISILLPADKIGLKKIGGSFAISWIHCGLNNIPYTWINSSGEIVRDTLSDQENAYFISYGRVLGLMSSNDFLVGGNLKIITQKFTKIKDASALGYGLDAGLIYSFSQDLKLGILLQKEIELKWDNQHIDKSPLRIKIGSSYKFLKKKSTSILGAIDLIQTRKQPLCAHLGSEFNYLLPSSKLSLLSLRAGIDEITIEDRYGNIAQLNNHINWTLGTGIKMKFFKHSFQFNYAFGAYRLGNKHRISLIIEFF